MTVCTKGPVGRRALLLIPLLSACCDSPAVRSDGLILKPDREVSRTIRIIERRLATKACVGTMIRWEKSYYFDRAGDGFDENRIVIRYLDMAERQTGHHRASPPPGSIVLDGRPYHSILADYQVVSGRLRMIVCDGAHAR